MAEEEEEVEAGLVNKGQEYPKTQAKPASTSEYSRDYRFEVWPPSPSEEHFEQALEQWQADARAAGLVPAKTANMSAIGEGGLMFINVTGRVKKAAKES